LNHPVYCGDSSSLSSDFPKNAREQSTQVGPARSNEYFYLGSGNEEQKVGFFIDKYPMPIFQGSNQSRSNLIGIAEFDTDYSPGMIGAGALLLLFLRLGGNVSSSGQEFLKLVLNRYGW
jgi:hypothetical protein